MATTLAQSFSTIQLKAYSPQSPTEDAPATPNPSSDPSAGTEKPPRLRSEDSASKSPIFDLQPMHVLKLLCTSLLYLLRHHSTSVTPFPPPQTPSKPNMKSLKLEKEELNARLEAHQRSLRRKAINGDGGPDALGVGAASAAIQHGAVIRKFYSKKVPPVPLDKYVERVQTYCAMSSAVCLAASHYIFQLALVERVLQLSELNVHRLVLAALRVSSKLLEDSTWAQARFCRVGGVTETEMKHLETSFCFATNFDLKVDRKILEEEYVSLQEFAAKAEREREQGLRRDS